MQEPFTEEEHGLQRVRDSGSKRVRKSFEILQLHAAARLSVHEGNYLSLMKREFCVHQCNPMSSACESPSLTIP